MPLTPQAAAIVDAFAEQPGVEPEHLHDLRQAIDASPILTEQINALAQSGALRRIAPHTTPSAGAYLQNEREMQLSLDLLSTSLSGTFNSASAIMVLGHELRHAADLDALEQSENRFNRALDVAAQPREREHDYTAPIGLYLSEMRNLEARAEISGWNSLTNAVCTEAKDKGLPAPELKDIYLRAPHRMWQFVDVDHPRLPATCTIKPNLDIDDHLHMAVSEQNLEGMARNFFDAGIGLGHHGNSNYANHYGAYAVGNAALAERFFNPHHHVRIDLAKLGLNPRTMAENGISLGDDTTPIVYVDRSTPRPTCGLLHDTTASHTYHRDLPRIDRLHHPGHQLYLQAMSAIDGIKEQERFTPYGIGNLAAALAVSAWRAGMDAIDHIHVQGNLVYAVQGNPYAATRKVAEALEKDVALRTPIEKSTMDWHLLPTAPREQLQTHEQSARTLFPPHR